MFGFPTDLFGMSNGQNRQMPSQALMSHHQSLLGHSLMMPSPFSGMNNLFSDFALNTSPFAMMDRMMRGAQHITNEPMQSFTSTTVMSFDGTDGRPKVYQESTSHRRGPGGIEETRQSVRDSERGINKVQIGHRIGDRQRVVEREMNAHTGQISENVELENLDEEETEGFRQEWRQRSAHGGLLHHPQPQFHHQIGSNRHFHQSSPGSQQVPLALEHNSSTRHRPKSSKHIHQSSQRPHFRPSDTIDLTDETPNRTNGQLPPPLKRKASASNDVHAERRHRQNRF